MVSRKGGGGGSPSLRPMLRDIAQTIYQDHLRRAGKVRWGDKTPGYIKIAQPLAAMFPDARFIHIFRDGRDVAKSFQAVGWFGPWLHANTRQWTEAIDWNSRLSRSEIAGRIFQLRYEDLVLEPEATLRKVCAFLEEE